jgi:hypothetical protein
VELRQWLIGLSFAIVVGGIVTGLLIAGLRRGVSLGVKPKIAGPRIPAWVVGAVERTVFCILVGLDVSGAVTAMMGWLALKMASNWNRKDLDDNPKARGFALSALLAGLVSMLFAALGGLICRGELWARYVADI